MAEADTGAADARKLDGEAVFHVLGDVVRKLGLEGQIEMQYKKDVGCGVQSSEDISDEDVQLHLKLPSGRYLCLVCGR